MRRELTHTVDSEEEATILMKKHRIASISYPPLYPIRDIRVERRMVNKGVYKWVVTADFDGWP